MQPFDTPAPQAAQGERVLTNLVSDSKTVRADPEILWFYVKPFVIRSGLNVVR